MDYPRYILGGIADKKTPRDYKRHAAIHCGARIVISEDIQDFFPSTRTETVQRIWQHVFQFHPEIAATLTRLTTYRGALPQGWKASGYLANLALWDREPDLVKRLCDSGFAYSRFVDDITISCRRTVGDREKSRIIAKVYGMLGAAGYSAKRAKHNIATSGSRMEVTGLNVNTRRPTLSKKQRHTTRAAVHTCESLFRTDNASSGYRKLWNSASGDVGTLKRFHPAEAAPLRERLRAVKPSTLQVAK